MSVARDKATKRAELRTRRDTFWSASQQRVDADRALQVHAWQFIVSANFRQVFIYLSTRSEAETSALIDRCQGSLQVCIPHILGDGNMEAVTFSGWSGLGTGPLGIRTAQSPVIVTDRIDAVVLPGLGFTRDGARLGYGKGFYDRWLARNPQALRIGLCFETQVCDHLALESHDEAIDVLVTDKGIWRTGARRSIPACGAQVRS